MTAFRESQDLIFGVTGQSIYYDCPEGQPTSVTSVSVFQYATSDTGTAASATTGSASIDGVTTTVDAASGRSQADPRKLYLADTSDVAIGRVYLVSDNVGRSEWVEVIGISSGDHVVARLPLANDYATGNSFVGTRVSISVDSTWIADTQSLSPGAAVEPYYRVRWVYVVAGVTYAKYITLDVVRYPGTHSVKPVDVDRLLPGWKNGLPSEYRGDEGASLIDEAWRQVQVDLHIADIADQQIRNQDMLDELVKRKAIALWAAASLYAGRSDPALTDDARAQYSHLFDSIFGKVGTARVLVAESSDGSGGSASPRPLFVR